jgi:hypothetical protein
MHESRRGGFSVGNKSKLYYVVLINRDRPALAGNVPCGLYSARSAALSRSPVLGFEEQRFQDVGPRVTL